MKKIIIYLLLISIFLTILISCTKILRYKEAKQGYWNHYLFADVSRNYITNGLAVNDQLIVSTYGRTWVFDDFTFPPHEFGGSTQVGTNLKPTLSAELSVHTSPADHSLIQFYRHTEGLHDNSYIQVREFGEQFEKYHVKYNYARQREIGVINSKNRFLTVIATFSGFPGEQIFEHLVFVDILPYGPTGNVNTTISDFGILEKPSASLSVNFSNIVIYNDKFYVAFRGNGNQYLQISENGIIKEFNPLLGNVYDRPMHTLFEFRGRLCAQMSNGLFAHTTDGENWIVTDGLNVGIFNYREIDGYLFFFRDDEIYYIEDRNGNLFDFFIFQIQTDNIKGRRITSINKLKEDLVITTSHGIFYKDFNVVINDAIKITNN